MLSKIFKEGPQDRHSNETAHGGTHPIHRPEMKLTNHGQNVLTVLINTVVLRVVEPVGVAPANNVWG